jgi:hypothetical protein
MERTYSLLSAIRSNPVKPVLEMSKAIRKHLEAMIRIVVVRIFGRCVVQISGQCVDIVPFLLIIAIL